MRSSNAEDDHVPGNKAARHYQLCVQGGHVFTQLRAHDRLTSDFAEIFGISGRILCGVVWCGVVLCGVVLYCVVRCGVVETARDGDKKKERGG